MKKILLSFVLLALLLSGSMCFAAVGIIDGSGAAVGQATDLTLPCDPTSAITLDGSRYNVGCNPNFVSTGISNGGETSMTSTTLVVPSSFSLVKYTLQTDSKFQQIALPAGVPGQELALICMGISQPGASPSVTFSAPGPAGGANFTSIKSTAKGDNFLLLYINASVGWLLQSWDPGSSNSITITLPTT